MMQENIARQRLAAGKTSLGCFLGLSSPAVAELFAAAGFDWLVVETEHSAIDWETVEHCIRAIEAAGTGTVPLVRLGSSDRNEIRLALDVGARGIVVPMVASAAEAASVVSATRYPPQGTRGFGPLRAGRYSFDAEYFARANDNIMVVLILETAGALDELEEICQVPGIDALYLGFADLSLAIGLDPYRLPHPEMDVVVKRIHEVCGRHGIALGNGTTTAEGLAALADDGYRMLTLGPDWWLLVEAARAGRALVARD
jgi:2-keto-3-deoxy-L-rhamnonate aldolase RhmA